MKEISAKTIGEMVRKEFKMARQFCRAGSGRYYKMMIDTSDGGIWSDCFICENTYKVYHSETIFRLTADAGSVKEIEEGYIKNAVNILKAAGWEITN